jgi:hypothetical protein
MASMAVPELVSPLIEPEAPTVLDHELETAGDAEAGDRRRPVHRDLGVVDLLGPLPAEPGHDSGVAQVRRPPLLERVEDDEHRAVIGAGDREDE